MGAPKFSSLLPFKNLRKAPRVRPDKMYPVYVDINGENFIDVLKAKDISTDGIGIYVRHDFIGCRIDREVELVITLPEKRPFKCRGKIRHKSQDKHFFFGVQFTDIRNEDKELIKAFVEIQLSKGMNV